MSRVRSATLAVLAVVAATLGGCVEKNGDYCADAAAYRYSCALEDAGSRDGVGETRDAAEASGDGDLSPDATDAVSDRADAMDAVVERAPPCTLMSCGADGGLPICDVDAGVCGACTTGVQCSAADPSLHSCEGGHCFACTKSLDCTDAPDKPICEAHACHACTMAAQCVARDVSLHGCEGGACYACTTNAECTDALTKPICDGHACRACRVDADCKGVGAEVCMEDGSCLATNNAIFAQARAAGCPGDGTSAMPYCAAQRAVTDALAATPTKTVVLVGPGIFRPISVNAAGKSLAIIARDPVALEPDNDANTGNPNVGVTLTDGDLLVRGLEIRKGNTTAVDAEGGVIRLHRCFIHDNAESGLIVKKAGFHVENTVFANNGGGTKANVDLEATTSTVKVFRNDTVVGGASALAGIVCAQGYGLTGVIAVGGPTPIGALCAAMDDCATMCSGHDAKLDPTTFALTAATPSACLDKLAAADSPTLDRAGKLRPLGAASDCGAYEQTP